MHSEGGLRPGPQDWPVMVDFALLETEARTKPVCVFWNHSIT